MSDDAEIRNMASLMPTSLPSPEFDLEQLLRSSPETAEQVTNLALRLGELGLPFHRRENLEVYTDLVKTCHNNLSLTLPFFFKYPKDEPMTLSQYTPFYPLFRLVALQKMVIIGGRQIAKSSSMAARQILKAHLFTGYNITYLAPRFEQAKIYGARLRILMRSYVHRNEILSTLSPNALFYKEFLNKSSLMITYALTNVDRTRGRSTDDLDLDEVQDLDAAHLPALLEMMQASSWKNVTYSGTAKSVDTTLEAVWQESSMGERIIPCHACNHENIPNLENRVMDMIQAPGLVCVHCGKLLDIRDAFWGHRYPDRVAESPGYHIPQIIIPYFVLDPIQWRAIYKKKVSWDFNDFISECLGISTNTGSREIDETDLKKACVLGDDIKTIQIKCTRQKYRYIISGLDWGGSDYQPMMKTKKSYTVHAVLGVYDPEHIELVHAKRYSGMDYPSITNDILDNHVRLQGTHLGSDFGAGQFYNWAIRRRVATEAHFVFNYSSTVLRYIQVPENSPMENQITLNRTESLSHLFNMVKMMRLVFPNWDKIQNFLREFLAVYRAPSETASGSRVFLYRKQGNKTDDFLHAVNFGYTVARILFGEISVAPKDIEEKQATMPRLSSLAPEPQIDDILYREDEDELPPGFL